jgi:hypothetical protein
MKNDHPNTISVQADIKDGDWTARIAWIISLVINGFIVYLWFIFGSAAAAGADTADFFGKTAAGVAVSVGGSLVAISFKRIGLGIILVWAMFPIVICFFNPSWFLRIVF